MAYSVKVTGLAQQIKRFSEIQEFDLDMITIGEMAVSDVTSHFEKSQGPDGEWASLKKRKGKPLLDKGRLYQSTDARARSSNSVEIFNRTPYAPVHNNGSKKKNIPKREFMFLSKDGIKMISKFIVEFIAKK